MTRIQVRPSELPGALPAPFGERPAVWSPIEVFRVTDGVVVGRWGYTDRLTSARRLAEQALALPIPTPRVVSLTRITLAPGTRWDAPRVAGPRLIFAEAGFLRDPNPCWDHQRKPRSVRPLIVQRGNVAAWTRPSAYC